MLITMTAVEWMNIFFVESHKQTYRECHSVYTELSLSSGHIDFLARATGGWRIESISYTNMALLSTKEAANLYSLKTNSKATL